MAYGRKIKTSSCREQYDWGSSLKKVAIKHSIHLWVWSYPSFPPGLTMRKSLCATYGDWKSKWGWIYHLYHVACHIFGNVCFIFRSLTVRKARWSSCKALSLLHTEIINICFTPFCAHIKPEHFNGPHRKMFVLKENKEKKMSCSSKHDNY